MQNKIETLSMKYKFITVFSILFSLIAVDQMTKQLAVSLLMGENSKVFLNGIFQLVYAENTGAFLGFGGSWPREVRFVIFALMVVLGLCGMLWYLLKKEKSRINLFAYTFILSGGFGNLWDRVYHADGHVVDFLFIEIFGPVRTGVFNLADVWIVIGVILALYKDYYNRKQLKPSSG